MKSTITVFVHLQPEAVDREIIGIKTVRQILEHLHIRQGTALVIRNGELLTQDLHVFDQDKLIIRKVMSSG